MSEDLHHLTAAHALDALDDDEARRYEAHLARCEPCRTELDELRATASQLAFAVTRRPPDGVRERVLAEVATTAQRTAPVAVAPVRPRRAAVAALAAAAVVLAVVAGAGLFVRDLVAQRDRAEELAAVLTADDARTAVLEGADDGGVVRVVWSPGSSAAVLVGTGLAPAGERRMYELWAFAEEGPRSAGVFDPEPDGRIRRRLELPAEPVGGWGITLEPVDGTPEPEGEIVYQTT